MGMFRTFLLVILFTISYSEHSNDLPYPRIILLTDSRTPFPGLANTLLGCLPEEENCLKKACHQSGSCSETISIGTGSWLGEGMNTTLINIQEAASDEDLSKILGETIRSTNLILIEIDATQELIESSILSNLRKLEPFLNFWDHVALQIKNFDQNLSKSKALETYQNTLKKEFKILKSLPGVFIGINTDQDPDALYEFQAETSKLFYIISDMTKLQMLTLEDIMRELYIFKSETIGLRDENMELKQELKNAKSRIKENDQKLTSIQVNTRLNKNQMKVQKSEFQMEISQRNKLLDQTMTPLGAIVAWLPEYSKTNHIPEGWQRCDGSKIITGPFTGRSTPDLNQRFLRGGSDGQASQFQEDAIQDHTHVDEGHVHQDSGHSHTDSGHHHEFTDQGLDGGSMFGLGTESNGFDIVATNSGSGYRNYKKWVYRTDTDRANIQTNYANIKSSLSGMSGVEEGRMADETRPKSMFVVYIIRIF